MGSNRGKADDRGSGKADRGAGSGPLSGYRSRRQVSRSGEPAGRVRRRRRGEPRFVIHKHDASTLHYDLRLEADGVLKSWAVPKGPSTDPRDKRLAHRTEDHPFGYADFEGMIPEGEYGAGTVIVWDAGVYRNLTERDGKPVPVAEAVEAGHVSVRLEGSKLCGGYALTRFRGKDDWLLVKMDDDGADRRRRPVSTQPESVRSGRTIEQVAASGSRRKGKG